MADVEPTKEVKTKEEVKPEEAKIPKIKITYFNVEGRAEKIRLVFAMGELDFEDFRFDGKDWPTIKSTTKFGGVPFMEVDGEILAQSDACCRYACRLARDYGKAKLDLLPAKDEHKIDEMLGLLQDMTDSFGICLTMNMRDYHHSRYGHPKDMKAEDKQALVKNMRTEFANKKLPEFVAHFEKAIKKNNNKFLCGETVTLADVCTYCALRNLRKGHLDYIPKTVLDKFVTLSGWMKRMDGLKQIKQWYETRAEIEKKEKEEKAKAAKAAEEENKEKKPEEKAE